MVLILSAGLLHPADLASLILTLLLASVELACSYVLYLRYSLAPSKARFLVFGLATFAALDCWVALDRFLFLTSGWYASDSLQAMVQGARAFAAVLIAVGVYTLGRASRKLEQLEES